MTRSISLQWASSRKGHDAALRIKQFFDNKLKAESEGKPQDSLTALIHNHFAQVSLNIFGFF